MAVTVGKIDRRRKARAHDAAVGQPDLDESRRVAECKGRSVPLLIFHPFDAGPEPLSVQVTVETEPPLPAHRLDPQLVVMDQKPAHRGIQSVVLAGQPQPGDCENGHRADHRHDDRQLQ